MVEHIDMRDMKGYKQLKRYLQHMPFDSRQKYLRGQVDMSFTGRKLRKFMNQLRQTESIYNVNQELISINQHSKTVLSRMRESH